METPVTITTGGRVDPSAVRRWQRYVAPFIRLAFRPRLDGTELLPHGPYMLVANHSGLGNAEIMSLIVCYLERFGIERPLAPMVHPLSFHAWPQGGWMKRLGAIPSTYEAAEATLAQGTPVLVFPGGDHEATRPVWQANQVQFAGRKGFLKIARKASVPIVPLGIHGSHYTAPVLYRSGTLLPRLLVLPRLFGIKKRFPITLSSLMIAALMASLAVASVLPAWLAPILAWLFMASPLATLPWIPWPIRMQIGAPLSPDKLFEGDDTLESAYARVVDAVQQLVSGSSRP